MSAPARQRFLSMQIGTRSLSDLSCLERAGILAYGPLASRMNESFSDSDPYLLHYFAVPYLFDGLLRANRQ